MSISVNPRSQEIEPRRQKQPFVIRGHHMDAFISLTRSNNFPAELAEGTRKLFEKTREEANALESRKKRDIERAHVYLRYAIDVIGRTRAQADAYQESLHKTFEEFIKLPDDYLIKLVAGQRDEICGGCFKGRHCDFKDQSPYTGNKDSKVYDEAYLVVFEDIA